MDKITQIKNEIAKVVVSQEDMIDALLVGILTNGHV